MEDDVGVWDKGSRLMLCFGNSDASQQLLSGCLRDFRNKPFPTRARIEYYMNTLTLYFHNGKLFFSLLSLNITRHLVGMRLPRLRCSTAVVSNAVRRCDVGQLLL